VRGLGRSGAHGFIASGCRAHHIPRLYFINKMDRRGADFFAAVQQIAVELGEPVLPLQLPTYADNQWSGIVDLVRYRWYPISPENIEAARHGITAREGVISVVTTDHAGIDVEAAPLSTEDRKRASEYREKLLDRASLFDDRLMEKIIKGDAVTALDICTALQGPVYRQELTPILCGSSFSDISSELLLNAIIDFLPDPIARGCPSSKDIKTGESLTLKPEPNAPFSAYIFKTTLNPDLSNIAWARVWSGTLRKGMKILAIANKKR